MSDLRSSGIPKAFVINLATAREGKEYYVKGRYIRVADATDTTTEIEIAVQQNIPSSYEKLKKNSIIKEGNGFDRIYVTNTAQANKTVRLIISEGPEDYDVDNPSIGTIDAVGSIDDPVEVAAHSTLVTTADDSIAANTTEQVLAINLDRKEAIITNLYANTDSVRVGDSSTGATRGVELSPGQSITLQVTAAIYVHNTKASAQSVAILEVE